VNTIGERIKSRRIELDLSQAELAQKSGMSTGAIGNYESETREPKKTMALAKALEVNRDWLETGKGEKCPAGKNLRISEVTALEKDLLDQFKRINSDRHKIEIIGYVKGKADEQTANKSNTTTHKAKKEEKAA
jgi:HTH-type transcriptional regulator, cell division transcriptional repressor